MTTITAYRLHRMDATPPGPIVCECGHREFHHLEDVPNTGERYIGAFTCAACAHRWSTRNIAPPLTCTIAHDAQTARDAARARYRAARETSDRLHREFMETPYAERTPYMRSRCQVAADAARTAADALADAARTVERTHHLIDTRSAA